MSLPEGWTHVDDGLPNDREVVLVIRPAGYTSARFEVLTARWYPDYALAPWRTLGNDSIRDDGEDAVGWRRAPEWLRPTV